MPTVWRQGDLIAPDDAVSLGAIRADQRDTHRALVISHSCDIAKGEEAEPEVEVLVGQIVPEAEATFRNGHSIHRLDLGTETDADSEWVKYDIAVRRSIPKARVLACRPWQDRRYPSGNRDILRRWLAQRYARSEFPDAFNAWLRESRLESDFNGIGKTYSACLVGIYFDLDDDTERSDPDAPYSLGIVLAYDSSDAGNEAAAEEASGRLKSAFEKRCKSGDAWKWFDLAYCEAVSDQAMTLHQARTLRRWRFEHRSLGGEPLDSSE